MILSQTPYPPWRGLAASLLLHAGLLGGLGPWGISSGDESPPPAMVALVSFPEAPVAAAPPALAQGIAAAPPAAPKSIRPARPPRPASVPAATSPPIRQDSSPSGQPGAEDAASVADGAAGNGEDSAVAGAANGIPDPPPTASDAVPMTGNQPPLYPLGARRAGREGRTVLLVTLSAAGDCVEVGVEVSSGTASLDEAAISAVKTWRFHPATRNAQPVSATLRVPIQFSLNSGLSGLPVVGQR